MLGLGIVAVCFVLVWNIGNLLTGIVPALRPVVSTGSVLIGRP